MPVVKFFSWQQIFMAYCIECGCPDDLDMRVARLVFMLGDL